MEKINNLIRELEEAINALEKVSWTDFEEDLEEENIPEYNEWIVNINWYYIRLLRFLISDIKQYKDKELGILYFQKMIALQKENDFTDKIILLEQKDFKQRFNYLNWDILDYKKLCEELDNIVEKLLNVNKIIKKIGGFYEKKIKLH